MLGTLPALFDLLGETFLFLPALVATFTLLESAVFNTKQLVYFLYFALIISIPLKRKIIPTDTQNI